MLQATISLLYKLKVRDFDLTISSYSRKSWMTADSGGVFGNFDSVDKLDPLKNLWEKNGAV